jgi:hypothetical protein
LGIEKPAEMTGINLLDFVDEVPAKAPEPGEQ